MPIEGLFSFSLFFFFSKGSGGRAGLRVLLDAGKERAKVVWVSSVPGLAE